MRRIAFLAALIGLAALCGALFFYAPGAGRFGEGGERFARWEESRVEAADEALRADDRPRAVALFRALAAKHPRSVYLHRQLGAALRASGEAEGALEAFRRAHELAPDDPKAGVDFVLALDAAGRTDEALREAIEAVGRLEPPPGAPGPQASAPKASSMLRAVAGALLNRAGRAEESLPILQRAVADDPRSDLAWHELGASRAARGDGDGADEAFGRALSLAPCDLPTLHAAAANALHGLGDPDRALRYAQLAIDCPTEAPRDKAGFFSLRADLLLIRGDKDGALFSLSEALEAGSDRKDWCDPASPFARALAGREEFRLLVREKCAGAASGGS